jgi:myo-inositol 2-dehydrogenase / D-chiro-inositol 1-dehydrogenase
VAVVESAGMGAEERIRYGFVGTGMMGIEHIDNVLHLDGATVTALADPHQRSIEQALEHTSRAGLDSVRVFGDHRELLDAGICDVIVLATPNHTHRPLLDDFWGRDVHLLVEKPLCTTVEDCRAVLDAAECHPGIVWVGLEYRYIPAVARLAQTVHDEALGTPRMVAIREHRFPFLPKVGDWNRFSVNTGGTLVEKCCHFFDLMCHLLRERPVRVYASGAQDVNHLDERYDASVAGRRAGEEAVPDILDNALVIVDFPSGARASLDLCMFAEASQHQEEISVVGDLGKAEALVPPNLFRFGERRLGRPGIRSEEVRADDVAFEGFHSGSSYREHVALRDAIRRGERPQVGLDDGLWSVAMGVAAHRSIDQARPVDLQEVM